MTNQNNQSVKIIDTDGGTTFNGRRTVRNISDDGEVATGQVIVQGQSYKVARSGWKWTGQTFDFSE